MSRYCEDCGCKMWGNICSNCQEELAILTYQAEDIVGGVSPEFAQKAEEQKEYIKQRDKK